MKQLVIAALVTLALLPTTRAQNLPDAPAQAPDPAWEGLQNLPKGEPVVITTTDSRSVHCLFAGITGEYLFCDPPGNPANVGFRFDRAQVASVDRDRPGAPISQAHRLERNYHPGWIASMIAGWIVVGLIASQNTDAGKATQDGFIGAAAVGLIGAPFAFLPHPQTALSGSPYPPYVFGARLRLPVRSLIHR